RWLPTVIRFHTGRSAMVLRSIARTRPEVAGSAAAWATARVGAGCCAPCAPAAKRARPAHSSGTAIVWGAGGRRQWQNSGGGAKTDVGALGCDQAIGPIGSG